MDSIFTIKTTSRQMRPTDARVVAKESAKDPVVSAVMRYCKEGWPNNNNQRESKGSSMSSFKQLKDSLSCESGCLLYGSQLVIPLKLQLSVLKILHQGHYEMQRMKQLSRTAVYWPGLKAPNHGHVPFVPRVHGTSEQSSASSYPSMGDARKALESSTH